MAARATLGAVAGVSRGRTRSGHMLFALVVTLAILTSATGCGSGSVARGDKRIEVLSPWDGSEKEAFLNVTRAFTQKTGIGVRHTTARDFVPVIRTLLAAGNPPDVAVLPQPGLLVDFGRQWAVKDLEEMGLYEAYMDARYSPAWIELGTVDGRLHGLPATASSKSVIWYRPDVFAKSKLRRPETWDELLRVTRKLKAEGKTPWAQGAKDSWTLTNWFENIYIRSAGPDRYEQLFKGQLPFTDPSVKNALTMMVQTLNDQHLVGGVPGALGTGFIDGIGQVFGRTPRAILYMEGGVVGGIAINQVNTSLKPGETIDFFPWPTINPEYGRPVIGGGDLAVAFRDDLDIREFLMYLSSAEAGKIWVSTGAVVSPNKQVPEASYPNSLVRSEARHVASAQVFRLDGSDLLPGTLANDWGVTLQGVLEDPGNVDSLLAKFETKAQRAF